MRVRVTAFEPFGGQGVNASLLAVEALPATVSGASVERAVLPCVFGAAAEAALAAVASVHPDVVVACGEHRGAPGLAVERVALNLASTSPDRPDNGGSAPEERPLVPGAPGSLCATLPVADCVRAARAAGVPAHLSCSAGLYVCNSVMYALLLRQRELLATGGPAPAMAGFVHVPGTPAQALRGILAEPLPSMATALSARGLGAVVATCVDALRQARA